MKKSAWIHKKYGKNEFAGSYARGLEGFAKKERAFVLSGVRASKPSHGIIIVFESHEAAKKLGWTKK